MKCRVAKIVIFITIPFLFSCVDSPDDIINPKTESEVSYISTSNGLLGSSVYSFFEDIDGSIWVGTEAGMNHITPNSITNFDALNNGIIDGSILAIARDGVGDLWASGENGFSYSFNGQWYSYSSFGVNAHYLDSQNNFYIGYLGGGVEIYDESFNFIKSIYDQNCFLCNIVTDFFPDKNGNIWVSTFDGAYKVNQSLDINSYTDPNGLTYGLMGGTFDAQGNIWMASIESNSLIKFANNKVSSFPIPVLEIVGSQSIVRIGEVIYIASSSGQLLTFDGTIVRESQLIPDNYYINKLYVDSNENLWIGTDNGIIKITLAN